MSSCVPSFVHGVTSSYVATVYMLRHWTKYGFIDNDMENKGYEVALMQFSCVRPRLPVYLEIVGVQQKHPASMPSSSRTVSRQGLRIYSLALCRPITLSTPEHLYSSFTARYAA